MAKMTIIPAPLGAGTDLIMKADMTVVVNTTTAHVTTSYVNHVLSRGV